MQKKIYQVFSLMLALILIFSIAGCSGDKQANQSNQPAMSNAKSIKLGTLVTLQPFMVVLKDELVKKGYNVELVLFDANNMPATATKDGNIDGFIHNHLPWIKTFNQQNNSKLEMMQPYLFYYRTAMYSSKYKNIDEFPKGIQIAIPNDPTNIETSLLMLQQLNLVTLGEKKEKFYTILDIKENPKQIKFLETEISTTARSISDAGAVICPAIRAKQAGIDPNSFLAEDKTTVNFPVGLTIDAKNAQAPWVKDAMDILKSESIKAKFNELYNGALVLL
ncbi:MetQ/NlpA family ABC transporter substrate-binding protein [Sporomusa aerivorans]|uniref:MetQ/NlpA family ABC transporter substrate-binding protein n=1 Tax=Sporomusa aerivorans TaxID=204936 RepID=UPI00352ACA8F